jgi:hypothetical protein
MELYGVLLMLPGSDGSEMYLLPAELGWCTAECGTGLALVEALAVTVVEGDISY